MTTVAILYNTEHRFLGMNDFELMALFEADDSLDDWEVAETAWLATQNHSGSWSRGEHFEDGSVNKDYRKDMTVIKPLMRDTEGKQWGHRSSMTGDLFIVRGKAYVCDIIGFTEFKEYVQED